MKIYSAFIILVFVRWLGENRRNKLLTYKAIKATLQSHRSTMCEFAETNPYYWVKSGPLSGQNRPYYWAKVNNFAQWATRSRHVFAALLTISTNTVSEEK